MSPVKVFGSAPFTNVARVLLCLEEVGADYEIVDVDFGDREHKGPDHLARNVCVRRDKDSFLSCFRLIH
jgi:glutathione S-transferase